METRDATFDELAAEGLIEEDNLYFPSGILITFTSPAYDEMAKTLNYGIEKWRSGLGAVGYDAQLKYRDSEWTIKKENLWIS